MWWRYVVLLNLLNSYNKIILKEFKDLSGFVIRGCYIKSKHDAEDILLVVDLDEKLIESYLL